jgi:hypothetical protein
MGHGQNLFNRVEAAGDRGHAPSFATSFLAEPTGPSVAHEQIDRRVWIELAFDNEFTETTGCPKQQFIPLALPGKFDLAPDCRDTIYGPQRRLNTR